MVVVAAFLFCLFNGYLQARYILYEAFYPVGYLSSGRFQLGLLVFIAGMAINIHSDHILRNLRRGTSDRGYKIPKGGLFEYVSAANYFGEIVEWCGYAILVNAAPAYAFAIFSACYLGCRGCEHHQFYLKQFSNYPKNRKAIIPFLI
jgi:steroid 5-alpha reductase family enzyme